jgi:peptidoglycan/xylan/chitin deacetylase (PgdA/CDA1 family)
MGCESCGSGIARAVTRNVALAYHAIADDWPHPLATTPAAFRRELLRLASRGFRGVTLGDLAAGKLRGRSVAITFDDGFASVVRARPILDELGWPATVFVVTDAIDSGVPMSWLGGPPGEHDDARRPLSWDALSELAAAGWEIGSHSRTHRLLSSLSDGELAAELAESRAAVATRIGSCRGISYPWGELNHRVVAAAQRAGFAYGSGLAGRFVRGDPMRVPRVAVDRNDGTVRFGLKTSVAFFVVRTSIAWTLLDALRRPGRPLGV